jgi:type II secretion system protein I
MSLLEVILALAILAGMMAVIYGLIRQGYDNGKQARDLTKAQLLCESKMAEIVAGAEPASPTGPTGLPWETNENGEPGWYYEVATRTIDSPPNMLEVTVRVTQNSQLQYNHIDATLVRWIVDPDVVEEAKELEAALADAAGETE